MLTRRLLLCCLSTTSDHQRTNLGVWHDYSRPQLAGASEIIGTVVEVLTGDTVGILPAGEDYDKETKLKRVSLASVRSPRAGNERSGKAEEPYALECKDRLRILTVGKSVKVQIHYERDIPMGEVSVWSLVYQFSSVFQILTSVKIIF